jgi:hypothetical protein
MPLNSVFVTQIGGMGKFDRHFAGGAPAMGLDSRQLQFDTC